LRSWSSSVEESWSGMGKPELTHQIICFKSCIKIIQMDSERDPHQHVLWSLDNSTISFEQVASFESLEPKIIVVEIPLIVQFFIDFLLILLDNTHQFWMDHACISILFVQYLIKFLNNYEIIIFSLLVQIAYLNPSSQSGVIWMDQIHVSACLC